MEADEETPFPSGTDESTRMRSPLNRAPAPRAGELAAVIREELGRSPVTPVRSGQKEKSVAVAPVSRMRTSTVPTTYSAQEVSGPTSALALPYSASLEGRTRQVGRSEMQGPVAHMLARLRQRRGSMPWGRQRASHASQGRPPERGAAARRPSAVWAAVPIGVPSAETRD